MKGEDVIKILGTLMDYGQLTHDLRNSVMEKLRNDPAYLNYEELAELSIIFANKFDKVH